MYLIRDFDSTKRTKLDTSKATTEGTNMMKKMNPQWAKLSYSAVDLVREKGCDWLCNPGNWTAYKGTGANFAIGAPSLEMYIKAYNLWKTGNKDSTNIVCRIKSAKGYEVGANGTYDGTDTSPISGNVKFEARS